ncbi:MAG TPA: ImmA/IrrE family metallo-endopeptidase [Methanosphaera sp.]|nr:ImmA/IrrE family metallo-endopeptidase [Methanosphaera sp.]
MISTDKAITSLDQLLTRDNLNHIANADFTVDDYQMILKEIYDESVENLTLDKNISALENIKRIAYQHVNIYFSEKEISSGYYIYNKIYLNNNLSEAQQIVTIIHELTHHIYAEIFEKWLYKLFNVREKFLVESVVMFMLNNSIENRIADEYLSYIVEGRFTPPECQNYLSFLQLLIELNINVEKSKSFFIFAHEISHDIDDILKPIITDKLKQCIAKQFVVDDIDKLYQKLTFDYCDERFDEVEKVEFMQEMLYFIFDYFINGEGNINDLEHYIQGFDNSLMFVE